MVAADQLATWTDTVRVSLHILAATVWVGGQIVVAGLLPTVRGFGEGAPKKVAQAFARVSWPAFIVLVATGVWNVIALKNGNGNHNWQVVMGVKYLVVLLAALAVGLHTRATTAKLRGISAGLGLLASLIALVLGVVLAG